MQGMPNAFFSTFLLQELTQLERQVVPIPGQSNQPVASQVQVSMIIIYFTAESKQIQNTRIRIVFLKARFSIRFLTEEGRIRIQF